MYPRLACYLSRIDSTNSSHSLLGPHFAASRMQAELSGLIVEDMKHGADAKEDQMVRD
jgi:hypothetical protein